MAVKDDIRVRAPLLESFYGDSSNSNSGRHPWMVHLSSCIAVCGSYEVGAWIGYSSPTQAAITQDLNLTTSEYALFGSILSIGAMIGAITSGSISDGIGRKWAMGVFSVWLNYTKLPMI